MDTLSPTLDRRTTKTRSVIFGALRSVGQRRTAEKLGIADNTLSDFMEKYGDRIAQLLTALELKPVPVGAKCISADRVREIEDEFQRLHYWASKGMAAQKAVVIVDDPGEVTGIHWDNA